MASKCIWYISKYIVPPDASTMGGRGYMIMRELARRGNQCLLFTSDSSEYSKTPTLTASYLAEAKDGMCLWWIRTFKYKGARSFKRIVSWIHFEWRLLIMRKSDLPAPDAVIVSSLSILTLLNGFLLRRKYQCKLIFEVRDIWPLTLTEEGGFRKYNPAIFGLGLLEKYGYKYADVVVGTMPNLREHVTGVLGYEREVKCVPMGFDIEEIKDTLPLPSGFREKYSLNKPFVVVHAGSVGVTNALETFFLCAQSLTDIPQIQFVLLGDGYMKAQYQERFKHLSNMTFAPKVPRKMVRSVLRECSVLYFSTPISSVWRYGQSLNKVIDYMLSGRPIIGSYSGYPSMINEAGCGSFVAPGDVEMLRSELIRYSQLPKEELDKMGSAGKKWILANRGYGALAATYQSILFPEFA